MYVHSHYQTHHNRHHTSMDRYLTSTPPTYPSTKRAQDVSRAHGRFSFPHLFYNINIYLWLDHTTSLWHVWPRDHCIDTSNQHQNDNDGPWPPDDERGLGCVLSLCCMLPHHHQHQHNQLPECVTLVKGESIAQEADNVLYVSWASR